MWLRRENYKDWIAAISNISAHQRDTVHVLTNNFNGSKSVIQINSIVGISNRFWIK